MRFRGFALLLLLTSLGGCLDDGSSDAGWLEPAPLGDPLASGHLQVVREEWDLGRRVVQGDGGAYLVHVHGSVHAPDDNGPYPVVLLMHGRHNTCNAAMLGETKLRPCPDAPPAAAPVDSYTGYDHIAEPLAGHGFVVLSLDVNHVNDQDNEMGIAAGDDYGATARGRIVLDVLSVLADAQHGADAGGLERLVSRLDLSRVGLMGHSRGGEGVARAWVLARDEGALPRGVSIGAVFALAPSDFFGQDVRGVPFATLLPYCDGDVYDLSGARMYDHARPGNTAPIHLFLVLGANHNHYNTVWTQDDWVDEDPWCGSDAPTSGRLTPEEQRQGGTALMGAFFRTYLGGETDLLPYLTGEESWWPLRDVRTSHLPPGATPVFGPDGTDSLGAEPRVEGNVRVTVCTGADCPAKDTYGDATQTVLEWSGRGSYSFAVQPATKTLTLRMGVDPASVTEKELDALVSLDRWTGRGGETRERFGVPPSMLGAFVPPGDAAAKTVLTTLRVDLKEDTHRVSLEFDGGAGILQVADWYYV